MKKLKLCQDVHVRTAVFPLFRVDTNVSWGRPGGEVCYSCACNKLLLNPSSDKTEGSTGQNELLKERNPLV